MIRRIKIPEPVVRRRIVAIEVKEKKEVQTRKKKYKRDLFVSEYLKDLNAAEAAKRCGYSVKSAGQIGMTLVKRFDEEIKAKIKRRADKIDISAEIVLQEIAKLAMVNVKDLYDSEGRLLPVQDLPRHVAASISSIKVKMERDGEDSNGNAKWAEVREIKFWDKKGSIELLMRHLNILGVDKKELSGPGGEPLMINIVPVNLAVINNVGS